MKSTDIQLTDDVYHRKEYAGLYLSGEAELFDFAYRKNGRLFRNVSIKRPVSKVGKKKLDNSVYDLETPYGYGGPVANCRDRKFIREALREYEAHCLENGIVAEFFRFNPFSALCTDHEYFFDFLQNDRKNVFVPLRRDLQDIQADFKPSLRRNIRKAAEHNLEFAELEKTESNIDKFRELYSETMKKRSAAEFYYFSREYFEKLTALAFTQCYGIHYHDKLINAIILLVSEDIVYYHLGATRPGFYHLNGNAYIFREVIRKMQGKYSYFMLGGGNSGDEKDSLFRFKSKFSSYTKDFYIGGKIYNREQYDKLTGIWRQEGGDPDRDYFLKYRLEPDQKNG